MRAQLGNAEQEAVQLRGALATAQSDLEDSERLAESLTVALQEARERTRLHLHHVHRLLSVQEGLLRERRELGTGAGGDGRPRTNTR